MELGNFNTNGSNFGMELGKSAANGVCSAPYPYRAGAQRPTDARLTAAPTAEFMGKNIRANANIRT
jgi:hypothetical protein